MFRNFLFVAALAVPLVPSPGRAQDRTYSAGLRHQRSLLANVPSKLSPSLLATRDAGGVLKGSDNLGNPVISVPASNVANFRASPAVESLIAEVPENYYPVQRLKLSYKKGERPTDQDLENLGLKLIEDYQKGAFLVVEPINKEINAELAVKLENSGKIQYATPTFRIKAIPPTNLNAARTGNAPAGRRPSDDPGWTGLCSNGDGLWGMKNIHAPAAWTKVNKSNVVVAVLDTGVDYTHEDLKDNIWSDSNGKHGFDFVDNDADPMDLNGHGTHCSGTIGARGDNQKGVVGVNWKVKIMAVRWLDAGGSGDVVNAIKAIDFAVDNGAKVLSNSWFWPSDDPDLEAAIERANASEVLFVAAAGNFRRRPNNNEGDNDQTSTFGRYPSAYDVDNIISVAAIDISDQQAVFSEWGKTTVDLAAPGVNILSSVPHDDYDCTFSGTSMATPHVAGAAALTMARYPNASYTEIKGLLLKNARKIDAMKDRCVTGGTLDISFLGESD